MSGSVLSVLSPDRLDREAVVVRLHPDPIRFVDLRSPAVVASDTHLLMVELQLDEIASHELMVMRGGFHVVVGVIVRRELKDSISGKADSAIGGVRQLNPADIGAIAIELGKYVGMVQLIDKDFVASNFCARLSIPVGLVRSSPVPRDASQLAVQGGDKAEPG